MNYDITYLSLGLGKQSTALAICSMKGLHGVPRMDCAIFADTGSEVRDTYEHLERMRLMFTEAGVPLHVVSQGNLGEELVGMKAKAKRGYIVSIPAFTKVAKETACGCREWVEIEGGDDTELGPANPNCRVCKGAGFQAEESEAPLRRQCTAEYKLAPIRRKVRELLGLEKGEVAKGKKMARALIGISTDEVIRAKASTDAWIENCYPLLDARLNVRDCMRICQEHLGYVPVKSACVFCPYHDNAYWNWMKTERPKDFEDACKVDDGIRDLSRAGVERPVYLHRSLTPLREIDFQQKDRNQGKLDGFGNECEGMCGV